MRRRVLAAPVAAASLALLGTAFAPAQALQDTEAVSGLVTPLSMAVDTDGTIYVSQNFAGVLTKKAPGQDPVAFFTATDQSEVGAVSVADGVVTFATTTGPEKTHTGRLWRKVGDSGEATLLLNTTAYEEDHNPDGRRRYGFVDISKACRAKAPKLLSKYTGKLDSHPYATAAGDGVTYLADAGGNDILAITDAGAASTVASLPPTRIKITKKKQMAMHLPRCTRGGAFKAEAVPTDVEIGPDGNLYVTSLPGGPEDPALGANGRVYQVNPTTGAVTKIAGDLVSPTGIAIAPNGTAYISMLFAGVVLKVPYGGAPAPFQQIDFPADVEYANGQVYVTRSDLMNDGSAPPNGAVLQFAP
jgi:hypothetical protein